MNVLINIDKLWNFENAVKAIQKYLIVSFIVLCLDMVLCSLYGSMFFVPYFLQFKSKFGNKEFMI